MARTKTCPKCQSSMSEGFVVDNGHGTRTVAAWVEGQPEKSIWTGLKLRGRTPIEIATWRCGGCGYLESYAGGR